MSHPALGSLVLRARFRLSDDRDPNSLANWEPESASSHRALAPPAKMVSDDAVLCCTPLRRLAHTLGERKHIKALTYDTVAAADQLGCMFPVKGNPAQRDSG